MSRRTPFLLAILLATLAAYSVAAVAGASGLHRLAGCEHSASHSCEPGDDPPRLVASPTHCGLCHAVGQAAVIAPPSPPVQPLAPRYREGVPAAVRASALPCSLARPRAPPIS